MLASERRHVMTPELVVWVLLAGLIGLVWVFTCTILTNDRSAKPRRAGEQDADGSAAGKPSRGRVAA